MSGARAALSLIAIGAALLSGGCALIGAGAYYLSPAHIQKAEYEFPEGSRVLLLVETANPMDENPVFTRALHERSEQLLRDGKWKASLVGFEELVELRQSNPDFSKASLQKIGRNAKADYVLYARIDSLDIRESLDARDSLSQKILSPKVDMRVKVIGVTLPSTEARVWPKEADGRVLSCSRQTSEGADPDHEDAETAKLAYDTAYWLTSPFIDVDLEKKPPVER